MIQDRYQKNGRERTLLSRQNLDCLTLQRLLFRLQCSLQRVLGKNRPCSLFRL